MHYARRVSCGGGSGGSFLSYDDVGDEGLRVAHERKARDFLGAAAAAAVSPAEGA